MAIQIKRKPGPTAVADLIDELGETQQLLKPLQKKEKELKSKITEKLAGRAKDPTDGVKDQGRMFRAVLSPQKLAREIENMQAVYDEVGHEAFLEMAKITLAALDAVVPKTVSAKFTREARVGSRSLKLERIKG